MAGSVNKTAEDSPALKIKGIAGQVYSFAPELDAATCAVVGACDCCSSKILFADNVNFIKIFYCESDEHIVKGTYRISADKVYLRYDTLEIDREYNWEMETDTTGTVETAYFIKRKTIEADEVILTALSCKKQVCFKMGGKEPSYGSLDKEISARQYIQLLNDQGVWDELDEQKAIQYNSSR
jgi:hypothetical protein